MQLVILSGKGGTGKTTIAASLAQLSKSKIKIDCDVDASNLHLLIRGNDIEESSFSGAKIAIINQEKCINCLKCQDVCRFNAIKNFKIDDLICEGCGACRLVCDSGAIDLKDEITGVTKISKDDIGILSRVEMEIGAEGSGRLVTEIREKAKKYIREEDLVILDGSPGIGCAVMASITGCDMALIVTEPTQSGLEDFVRILSVCKYFGLRSAVCINKFDINEKITRDIEELCINDGIDLVGKIPFDRTVKTAINYMKPVVLFDSPASKEIKRVWSRIIKIKEAI